MSEIRAILDSSILQGLGWGLATFGLNISLRIFRFPDLTVDGSFTLGAAVFSTLLVAGLNPAIALVISVFAGGVAGILTGFLNTVAKIGKLLSGILVMTALYSINFRILGNSPNQKILDLPTLISPIEKWDTVFSLPLIGVHIGLISFYTILWIIIAIFFSIVYKSELGLTFRYAGFDRHRADKMGFKSKYRIIIGIGVANAIVALSGIFIAQEIGFADINMGSGLIITALASLLIGEQVIKFLQKFRNIFLLSPISIILISIIGTFIYYLIIGVLLRLSAYNLIPLFNLQPTDLKLFSALIVIIVILLMSKRQIFMPREELL